MNKKNTTILITALAIILIIGGVVWGTWNRSEPSVNQNQPVVENGSNLNTNTPVSENGDNRIEPEVITSDIDTSDWQTVDVDRRQERVHIEVEYSFKIPPEFQVYSPGTSPEGGTPVVHRNGDQEIWVNVSALGTNADVELYKRILAGEDIDGVKILNNYNLPIMAMRLDDINSNQKKRMFVIPNLDPHNEYSAAIIFSNILEDNIINAVLNSFVFE